MVTPCGGNAAQPIPGSGQSVVVTAAGVESALILLDLEPAAAVLAPLLAGEVFNLTQLCGADPPADPGLTGQDLLDATNWVDPTVSIPAIAKVRTWFESWYWYFACQCVGVATPATPAPSNPGRPVGLNTGLPGAPLSGPCWDFTKAFTTLTTSPGLIDLSALLPSTTTRVVASSFTGGNVTARMIPPGTTQATLTLTTQTRPTNNCWEADLEVYDANGVELAGIEPQQCVTADRFNPSTLTLPSNAVYWSLWGAGPADGATHEVTVRITLFCNGQGANTLAAPCCPPDPSLVQQLAQVLGLVTLIQRQTAPFAYTLGTRHAGLVGKGQLAVQGLLGAKVLPAAIPTWAGVEAGDPDTLWLESWVNWGNADGWTAREFLRSSPHVSLPALAGQFTLIGYSLAPGLTVDITELVREP